MLPGDQPDYTITVPGPETDLAVALNPDSPDLVTYHLDVVAHISFTAQLVSMILPS